jgi:hypothetical protein
MLRKVSRVDRRVTHTHSGYPIDKPFTVVTVHGCVHECCVFGDGDVPAEIECERCGDLAPVLERIREFVASPEYSHATIRSTAANRCRAWESYFFYRRDPSSPTQCVLEFGAPACDEIKALLSDLRTRAVPGPSRGEMALL